MPESIHPCPAAGRSFVASTSRSPIGSNSAPSVNHSCPPNPRCIWQIYRTGVTLQTTECVTATVWHGPTEVSYACQKRAMGCSRTSARSQS